MTTVPSQARMGTGQPRYMQVGRGFGEPGNPRAS